jgi:glycerol kinase
MGTELKRAGALNPSVGWRLNGVTNYMLEGSSFTAGACLEWAKNDLKLFDDFGSMNGMAEQASDNSGVYFVPALTGLSGIPYNDETARGAFMGITPKATRNHFVRAILEGIGFATVCLMEEAIKAGIEIKQIKLSGGVSQSGIVGQLISNLTGAEVIRPKSVEATALGAAEMAAIKMGWVTPEDTARFIEVDHVFMPDENQEKTKIEFTNWKNAASRTLNWLS